MPLLSRAAWVAYMTRLRADWKAYREEWECERGPDACVVDDFLRSLCEEWMKRGRIGL